MENRMNIFKDVKWEETSLDKLLENLENSNYSKEDISKIRNKVDEAIPFIKIGHELIQNEEYLYAIKILKNCVELYKDEFLPYVMLASCFVQFDDEEKASFMLLSAQISRENKETLALRKFDEHIGFIKEQTYDKNFVPIKSEMPILGEDLAGYFYNLGNACLDIKCYFQAEVCFRLACKQMPTLYEAYANQGLAMLRLGFYYEAIRVFFKALNVGEPDEIILNNLGKAFQVIDYPIFGKLCFLTGCILNRDYKPVMESFKIKTVDEGLFEIREELAIEFWNPKRLAALALDAEAGKEIESAELLSLNYFLSKADNAALPAIRSYLAGFEKELKVSFFQLLMGSESKKILGNRPLTLGSMINLLVVEVVDYRLNEKRQLGASAPLKDKAEIFFMLRQDEIQLLANIINTLLPIRNAVAHGDKLDQELIHTCKALVKAGLLLLMRAQLNKVFGKPFNFSLSMKKQKNGFTVSHWMGDGDIF